MISDSIRSDMPSYQPLLIVFAAASIGILADQFLMIPMVAWLLIAAVSLVGWYPLRYRFWSAALLLIAAAAIAAGWHHRCWYLFAADDLGFMATAEPRPVAIEATARSGPRRMPAPPRDPLRPIEIGDRTRMELNVTAVRDGLVWKPASGNATLIVHGHLVGISAGDRLRIFGQLQRPASAQNPGEFDYAEYCRGNRVLCLVRADSPSDVEVLSKSSEWRPGRWIDQLRGWGADSLWRFISPQNAGLAAAMFLGLRDELDPEQMDAFKETGTVHLLVISGLNVGILAACVLLALRTGWLSSRAAMGLLAVVAVLYATITDSQPPVVRATVLVLVFCLASVVGRRGLAFNSLAAAALIVLAFNPVELFRAGTQLSFLAVAALIAVGQSWLTKRDQSATDPLVMQSLPARMQLLYLMLRIIWQATIVSFAVWVVVQPLVAARFNLVTPSAIILGPLLAIPVAVAMAMGFAVMVFGWLLPPLGAVCGFVCDRSLSVVTATVDAARDAPGGKFWTSGPADWWLAGFYGMLAAWVLVPAVRRLDRRWLLAAAGGWVAVGLLVSVIPSRPRDAARVTFLSVGHGLSVVIELPDGRTILYDAGSMGPPELTARTVGGYLFSRGIRTIDYLVISHADADHYNAIPQLLKQFDVQEIYYSGRMFRDDTEPLSILHAAIDVTGKPQRVLQDGDFLVNEPMCTIEVLHPPAANTVGSDNSASIVLRLTFAGRTILLTGDLESPGLEQVMAKPTPPVDVLLAPHHGSARSDPPGLAQWARPAHVVVSGGEQDRSPAVRRDYEKSGAQVFHAAECGAIWFEISRDTCEPQTFRGAMRTVIHSASQP